MFLPARELASDLPVEWTNFVSTCPGACQSLLCFYLHENLPDFPVDKANYVSTCTIAGLSLTKTEPTMSLSTNKVCLYLHVYEGLSDFPVNGAEEPKWDRQLEEKALHKL